MTSKPVKVNRDLRSHRRTVLADVVSGKVSACGWVRRRLAASDSGPEVGFEEADIP